MAGCPGGHAVAGGYSKCFRVCSSLRARASAEPRRVAVAPATVMGKGRCPDLGEEATEDKSDSLSREQSGGREADALGTDGGRDELHGFGDNLHLIGGAGTAERRLHQVRGEYRWVRRTIDRLLARSRVHGTASCSRVVCTTHRGCVTQRLGPFA